MSTTTHRSTAVSAGPSTEPRLMLTPTRANHAVLDGGWWPRSSDPVAELPGLVIALSERYGQIRSVMLNSTDWSNHFRRLTVGDRVVRAGWFASVDPGVMIATTGEGTQIDLLVVPSTTAAASAESAMATAADPANRMRGPAILAAVLPAADKA